jgi:hypothetical protein
MSESVPTTAFPSPIIVRIISDYACAVEALAAASADSLNHAMLRSSYENAINLACILHSSKNLTNQYTMLITENEDLALERDAAMANCNVLTARVMQPKAQLMQTLMLMTATTNSSPAGHKGKTNPEMFTREDHGNLRSFVALLHLWLINYPGDFPSEQSKLQYAFYRLEGATLE